MREIRFRGRDLENDNQWRYGSLIQYPHGECVIVVTDSDVKELSYEVDPDTVGQDTEITDRNGKPIHEGDVLLLSGIWRHDRICAVFHAGCSFYIGKRNRVVGKFMLCNIKKECMEVVGNIHDNPELSIDGEYHY